MADRAVSIAFADSAAREAFSAALVECLEHCWVGPSSDDEGMLSRTKRRSPAERLAELSVALSGPSGDDLVTIRRVASELRVLAGVGLDEQHLPMNVPESFR